MKKTKTDPVLILTSLHRLYLSQKGSMETITCELMGCQAQFANNPAYSMMIRANDFDAQKWQQDYYKLWSLRGTIHTIHPSQISWLLSARSRHHDFDDLWDISRDIKPFWSDFICQQVLAGNDQREGLKLACEAQGMNSDLKANVFHGWGGLIREMSDRGMIAYENSTKKRFIALPKPEFMDVEKARIQVVDQYFKTFGPATIQDCMYYTSYKLVEVKRYMKELPALQSYQSQGKQYYYQGELILEGKVDDIIILTGFDPLILGYKDKSRFLDESENLRYVTNTGIIHRAILIKGRLKAKWKKLNDQHVRVTLYKPISKATEAKIERQFRRLFKQRTLGVDFICDESVL